MFRNTWSILTLTATSLLLVLPACQPSEPKIRTVAVLQFTKTNLPTLEGFKKGLAELGYIEGKTIRYLFEGPVADRAKLLNEAQKLVAQKPDLLFTSPTPATQAAQQATRGGSLPVVFAPVNDPLAAGIVASLKEPGGNITGIRLAPSDGVRMEWLQKINPGLRAVYLPYNSKDKSALTSLEQARQAAEALRIELIVQGVRDQEELSAAMAEIPDRAGAVFLPRDGLVMSRIADWVELCRTRRMMLSSPRQAQVVQGALVGYGFVGFEIGKQAARLADRILKGADPGKLPVETAEDYLFINLKTAREIGLEIGESILRQAKLVVRP